MFCDLHYPGMPRIDADRRVFFAKRIKGVLRCEGTRDNRKKQKHKKKAALCEERRPGPGGLARPGSARPGRATEEDVGKKDTRYMTVGKNIEALSAAKSLRR